MCFVSQLNRETRTSRINSPEKSLNLHKTALFPLITAAAAAVYMIWHYLSFGQWNMDGAMQAFMKDIRTSWLDVLFKVLTATGETIPVIAATAVIVISLIIYKKRVEALLVALYMLGIWRFNEFLKVWLHRPRPDVSLHLVDIGHYNQANSFSMPSGHSMNLMALMLLAVYLVWHFSSNKKFNVGATVFLLLHGLLTGMSRVYLNVHYFSDVLTGWSISIVWVSATIILHRVICLRQKKYNI